jgi:hypothetical protein
VLDVEIKLSEVWTWKDWRATANSVVNSKLTDIFFVDLKCPES